MGGSAMVDAGGSDRPGNGDHRGLWAARRLLPVLRNQSIGAAYREGTVLFRTDVRGETGNRHGRRAADSGERGAGEFRRAGGGRIFERRDSGTPAHQGSHATVFPPPQGGWNPGGTRVEPVSGSATGGGGGSAGAGQTGPGGGHRRRRHARRFLGDGGAGAVARHGF